ncbi:response regulator [Alginatibacterium sediminis]|uniref:Transcriptional regulatory protein n=1 Tax=Alginatibacterium sediminis TaxID=2164068 RepID=A0A420ED28_9ALTE|nr:response regulator [Alginatibacterium sediminis]RKF18532.1 response regulator [Alginatibacterium sediminis]
MIHVLIVEDDPGIAEIHQQYLKQVDGFSVQGVALSIMEAKIQLKAKPPQLVLLDVYLPDGTGIELLQFIRGEGLAVDVIMLTAASEASTLQNAMRNGVFDYILKPIIFPRLRDSLYKYQKYLSQVNQRQDIQQGDVDRLMPMSESNTEQQPRPPKGIDSVTLDNIRQLFLEHPSLSADDAGKLIGSSRTTARRYLEYLVSCHELVPAVSYGSVGRPERIYSLKS